MQQLLYKRTYMEFWYRVSAHVGQKLYLMGRRLPGTLRYLQYTCRRAKRVLSLYYWSMELIHPSLIRRDEQVSSKLKQNNYGVKSNTKQLQTLYIIVYSYTLVFWYDLYYIISMCLHHAKSCGVSYRVHTRGYRDVFTCTRTVKNEKLWNRHNTPSVL